VMWSGCNMQWHGYSLKLHSIMSYANLMSMQSVRQYQSSHTCPHMHTWAARYNTWLLLKLTPKGVVFSFLSHICTMPGTSALVDGALHWTAAGDDASERSDAALPIPEVGQVQGRQLGGNTPGPCQPQLKQASKKIVLTPST